MSFLKGAFCLELARRTVRRHRHELPVRLAPKQRDELARPLPYTPSVKQGV